MKNCALSIFVFFLALSTLFAQDDDDKNPILTEEFIIEAGWFFPSENVDVGVAGSTDLEDVDNIDFDETLGLSGGQNTFRTRCIGDEQANLLARPDLPSNTPISRRNFQSSIEATSPPFRVASD